MSKSDRDRAGELGRGKRVRSHHRIKLPVGQFHLVAQAQRIPAKDGAQHARQLVLGADPDLHEHIVVDQGHHVGRRSADDLGLADVEGDGQALGECLVGIGKHHIAERKVDCRAVESRFECGIDRRRRRRDSDQILGRGERRHRLAIVIELRRRSVAERDHAQLVGPLHDHLGHRRIGQRGANATRAFVSHHRRERQRTCRRQTLARRFQQVNRLGFEFRLGRGRHRFARRLGGGGFRGLPGFRRAR